jgi:hypothetical protein
MNKSILIAMLVIGFLCLIGIESSEAEESAPPPVERKYAAGPTLEQIEEERLRQAILRMRSSLQSTQPRWVQLPVCYDYYWNPALIARQEAHRRFLFHARDSGLYKEVPLHYRFHNPGYRYPASVRCW